MAKRCNFCAQKLNEEGYCENPKCPENLRCEIIEKSKEETAGGTTNE